MLLESNKRYAQLRSAGAVALVLVFLALTLLALLRPSNGGRANLKSSRGRPQPSFSVDFGEPVAMRIAASAHYAIDTAEGAEEWAKLLPPTGHLVHVSDSDSDSDEPPKAHTVTLFHQLKCLDIIRSAYLAPSTEVPSGITEHCMNYLRETVLCASNLWLESAKNTFGTASRAYDAVCRDWERVYAAAARNHAEVVMRRLL